MAYWRKLFGGEEDGGRDADRDVEIVEQFVERVETSTAIEDRRDALKTLRTFAKTMRLPVATIGMPVFMSLLEKERNDPETLALTLETISEFLAGGIGTEDGSDELGERLAEMFVRKATFMSSVLSLIENCDFNVRRAVVELLCNLLKHRGNEVQTAVMSEPMGVSRLVDLLNEKQEVLRNNTILTLCELSRANSQIQQLLAYENTFQRLFEIINGEPPESIVIEDCLFLILTLLRKNPGNQQFFREASLVKNLGSLLNSLLYTEFVEEPREEMWPTQRVANVIILLQVVRSLVSPHENTQANIHAAQKTIYQTGILAELCDVLNGNEPVTEAIRTESVVAVAECIRGNYTNQELFANRHFPDRPSPLYVLHWMTEKNQPLKFRCAVFYCFLSYLYDNEFGKRKVIDTLLPSDAAGNTEHTAGQFICSAIMSSQAIQVWMGCVCVMHCILDADHLKQQLLRVQLSTNLSEKPSSLLLHLGALLISFGNRKPQVRVGLLMLLSVWLHNCPVAVSQFVQVDEHIDYLTTHIDERGAEGSEDENQATRGLMALLLAICVMYGEGNAEEKDSLNMILERRVGREKIVELLEGISYCECFVRAAKRPQQIAKESTELLFDYQFIKLFKILEPQLVKQFRVQRDSQSSAQVNGGASENVVASYKELIKRQDATIADLTQQLKKVTSEKSELEMNSANEQLALKCRIEQEQRSAAEGPQIEHCNRMAAQWKEEMERYQKWALQWQQYQLAQLPNPQEAVVQQLVEQVNSLDQDLSRGWSVYEKLSQEDAQKAQQLAAMEARVRELEQALAAAVKERDEKLSQLVLVNGQQPLQNEGAESEQLVSLKKEQEDLLVLLADQDTKLSQYRKRLLDLGQPVTDDEDETEA